MRTFFTKVPVPGDPRYLGCTSSSAILACVAETVGGGTYLPIQSECLEIMGCKGSGYVDKFVEICAVATPANEISFLGAICSDEWIGAQTYLKGRTTQ